MHCKGIINTLLVTIRNKIDIAYHHYILHCNVASSKHNTRRPSSHRYQWVAITHQLYSHSRTTLFKHSCLHTDSFYHYHPPFFTTHTDWHSHSTLSLSVAPYLIITRTHWHNNSISCCVSETTHQSHAIMQIIASQDVNDVCERQSIRRPTDLSGSRTPHKNETIDNNMTNTKIWHMTWK